MNDVTIRNNRAISERLQAGKNCIIERKDNICFDKERIERDEKDFCKNYSGNDMMGSDIICIVSIKKSKNGQILDEVKAFDAIWYVSTSITNIH